MQGGPAPGWRNSVRVRALTPCFCLVLLLTGGRASASDHLDVIASGVDLLDLYVFKSPSDPNRVVMVLDTGRSATAETRFEPGAEFSVAFRAAEPSGTAFRLTGAEGHFECVFRKPPRTGPQTGECRLPDGRSVIVNVNDPAGTVADDVRVFAGIRSDPFFMAAGDILAQFLAGGDGFDDPGVNGTAGQNVLSIVIEADVGLFGGVDLLAFKGGVSELCPLLTRLWCKPQRDAVGRPEITNMVLLVPFYDKGNRLKFLRRAYNREDTFAAARADKEQFTSRMDANLHRWDNMDGQIDWPLDGDGAHPLTELLYGDYLLFDPRKPFAVNGFLDIEKSHRAGRPHRTSGGRWLGEDVVDDLLTWWVARDRRAISDHVAGATHAPLSVFPYVAPAD